VEFDYLDRAVNDCLFTGAIPLLFDAGASACCVSTLLPSTNKKLKITLIQQTLPFKQNDNYYLAK